MNVEKEIPAPKPRPGSPNYKKNKLIEKAEKIIRKYDLKICGKFKKLNSKQLTGFIGELKKAGLKQ